MIFKEIACTLVSKHDLLIRANDLVSHWNKLAHCYQKRLSHPPNFVRSGNEILCCGNEILIQGNEILTCENKILTCGNKILIAYHKIVNRCVFIHTHPLLTH